MSRTRRGTVWQKCRRYVSECSYCHTGRYKAPARRALRRTKRADIMEQTSDTHALKHIPTELRRAPARKG